MPTMPADHRAEPFDAAARVLAERVPGVDASVVGLVVGLARLARVNDAVLARLAAAHTLGPSDTSVLIALWLAGPPHRLSPTYLAEGLVQTSGGMTATLRRLASRDFVTRLPDPTDGRRLLVQLTPRGRTVGLAAFEDMANHYAEMFGDLPEGRREQLDDAVRTMLDVLGAGTVEPDARSMPDPDEPEEHEQP